MPYTTTNNCPRNDNNITIIGTYDPLNLTQACELNREMHPPTDPGVETYPIPCSWH